MNHPEGKIIEGEGERELDLDNSRETHDREATSANLEYGRIEI